MGQASWARDARNYYKCRLCVWFHFILKCVCTWRTSNTCLPATYDTCSGQLMREHQLLLHLVQPDQIGISNDHLLDASKACYMLPWLPSRWQPNSLLRSSKFWTCLARLHKSAALTDRTRHGMCNELLSSTLNPIVNEANGWPDG